MTRPVEVLPRSDLARWDSFVLSHELGTAYHTSAWRHVIERAYGHRPMYLIIDDGAGKIRAGLPLFLAKSRFMSARLVCVPAAQACDPLVSNQADYDRIVAYALAFMKQHHIESLELRTTERFRLDSHRFGRRLNGYHCSILDLGRDLEAIEQSLHKDSIRRRIKHARHSGLQTVVGHSLADVKAFYDLHVQLRKRYGLLPQPYEFFRSLWQIMSRDQRIDILHATFNGRIISSALLLKYKDTVVVEYSATRLDARHLGASPFLLWEAICRAKSAGYKRFDLGRTADDNQSLARFKARWGTRHHTLSYYFIPDCGQTTMIRQNEAVKRMMSRVMHQAPASWCQLMGRVLFRHVV